jgi:phage terminase large subunit-like protein
MARTGSSPSKAGGTKERLDRAERVIRFIETYCLVPEGDEERIGKPLKLEPFQRKFITETYSNPYGTHSAYLSIARKNGKTALIAALLLAHM